MLIENYYEQFEFLDKTLASSLMTRLSMMKLIGIKYMWEHIMRMKNIVAQLKSLKIEVSGSFLGAPHIEFNSRYFESLL